MTARKVYHLGSLWGIFRPISTLLVRIHIKRTENVSKNVRKEKSSRSSGNFYISDDLPGTFQVSDMPTDGQESVEIDRVGLTPQSRRQYAVDVSGRLSCLTLCYTPRPSVSIWSKRPQPCHYENIITYSLDSTCRWGGLCWPALRAAGAILGPRS